LPISISSYISATELQAVDQEELAHADIALRKAGAHGAIERVAEEADRHVGATLDDFVDEPVEGLGIAVVNQGDAELGGDVLGERGIDADQLALRPGVKERHDILEEHRDRQLAGRLDAGDGRGGILGMDR
jgi:hypothetical protein